MFEELRRKFQRFFFLDPTELNRSISAPISPSLVHLSSNPVHLYHAHTFFAQTPQVEGELIEIIKDRIYLSNLPHQPFLGHDIPKAIESALLVSCLEIEEIARSRLLLEPNPHLKYHILPLADTTPEAGCIEQVIETLVLMSQFDDANKKIQVHSFAGVYRNAMMVALYLSYRYLQGDKKVIEVLDGKYPLAPGDLKMLYRRATTFVSDREIRSELDTIEHPAWVHEVLVRLKNKHKPVTDENYLFLAGLVQSLGFKKIQYHYYSKFELNITIKNCFDDLIMNREGWYKQLCKEEWRSLFQEVLKEINFLAERYPNSFYAQHVNASAYQTKCGGNPKCSPY